MTMETFLSSISNFGFPIVLAAYLLFRLEGKIENFGKKIDNFSDVIEGKPSDSKPGLINVLQQNSRVTKELANKMEKIRIGRVK